MAKVYLNGKELSLALAPDHSLADVLAIVQKEHLSSDELIRTLLVDGNNYFQSDDFKQRNMADEKLSLLRSIEMFSGSKREVASESLKAMAGYIERLVPGVRRVAEDLRFGDFGQAMTSYGQALEGIWWMVTLLGTLEKMYGFDYSSERAGGSTVSDHLQVLLDKLGQLVDAQERGDLILMADILDYELSPTLDNFRSVPQRLQSLIASMA